LKPVVIAGAGLSGLAAGVYLASRKYPVAVFEQRAYPGGRTYSFPDPQSGETVDNGQHVLIAGYDGTMALLDMIGTRNLIRVQRRPHLLFHHPDLGFRSFSLPRLPSPLHLAWGMLTSNLFRPGDRLRLLRSGIGLLRSRRSLDEKLSGKTVAQWLELSKQSTETRRALWEPLAIAIMNEHCSTASASLFIRSLRKAFLEHWHASAFAIPTVGLSQLFAGPAVEFIRRNCGEVHCGLGVAETLITDGKVSAVRMEDGSQWEAAGAILAVPSYRVQSILPEPLKSQGFLAGVEMLPQSPIVSVHLWFAADFMGSDDIVGVIGRRIQWIFNRRSISPTPDGISRNLAGGYVSAVISAAHNFVGMSNEDLVSVALEDLHLIYGPSIGRPSASLIVREKRATFSSSPLAETLRPSPRTPVPNLFLAGDWTDTGYPATIEGAIISGRRSSDLMERWMQGGGASVSV
jgi:squalene-associated FAD-dependent desaturase